MNYKLAAGFMAAMAAAPVAGSYLERPAIEQRLTAGEVRSPLERALAEITGRAEAAEARASKRTIDSYNWSSIYSQTGDSTPLTTGRSKLIDKDKFVRDIQQLKGYFPDSDKFVNFIKSVTNNFPNDDELTAIIMMNNTIYFRVLTPDNTVSNIIPKGPKDNEICPNCNLYLVSVDVTPKARELFESNYSK